MVPVPRILVQITMLVMVILNFRTSIPVRETFDIQSQIKIKTDKATLLVIEIMFIGPCRLLQ